MKEHRHFAAKTTRDGVSSTSTASDNPDSETIDLGTDVHNRTMARAFRDSSRKGFPLRDRPDALQTSTENDECLPAHRTHALSWQNGAPEVHQSRPTRVGSRHPAVEAMPGSER